MRRSRLTIAQILEWADSHFKRTGEWPTAESGRVWGAPDESWINIDSALRTGLRGLQRGQSLARLLAKHRGVRNRKGLPPYSVTLLLTWIDARHDAKGAWPHRDDGPIPGTNGETWFAVDMALSKGLRGMPGGSSLAKFLMIKRGVRNKMALPRLKLAQVLDWVDEHKKDKGTWPIPESGPIPGTTETWLGIDKALRKGARGLRRSSLSRVLESHRGVQPKQRRQRELSIREILAWGDIEKTKKGKWPTVWSGPIDSCPGERWGKVQHALLHGARGLPGGMTLSQLWAEHRGARIHLNLPVLTEDQIIQWIKLHKVVHGGWPHRDSGPIPNSGGETWCGVVMALRNAGRGLKRRSTLKTLIAAHF